MGALAERAPHLIAAFYLLAAVALFFSNPPGASPDETAHYLRAMGVGRGQLVLERPDQKPVVPPELTRQVTWMWMQGGVVSIPARLSTAPFECWAHVSFVGSCRQSPPPTDRPSEFSTYVGAYPPYPYLVSGALMRLANDSTTALQLGRLGIMLISLPLLAAAAFAAYQRPAGRWLLGLLVTVSPMVLINAASLSSSGVEISAAVCFFTCLLRLVRGDQSAQAAGRPAPWVWVAAGVSGLVLAVSRDLGPAWVLLHLGLVGVYAGYGRVKAAWEARSRAAVVAAGLLALSLAIGLVWRMTESVSPDLSRFRVPDIDGELALGFLRQAVGVFGPLDAFMPDWAYLVWGVISALLVGSALLAGSWNERLALLFAVVTAVVVTYALEGAQNIYGFGAQSRHVLPAVVCIPLLAGEVVARRGRPRWLLGRAVAPVFAVAAAAVHLTAWHTLGRRFAVGSEGPPLFFWDPLWSPPGGWLLWAAVTSLACAILVLPFVAGSRKETRHRFG
ncbi:MAG TPA: DUF2142 domain-containing protein [Actinomycetota bacterium]|nr:DUF2142 domain-containing protein [Actinomycetota bacterium]